MTTRTWIPRMFARLAPVALGGTLVCAPMVLDAQVVSVSSAANQLFHVNDASTTASTITVTDVSGGNIKFNKDIRLIIPATFNMTWDTSVLTVTLSGTASARCSATVTYQTTRIVVINVLSTFVAGETVIVSGLKFTNFTAVSASSNLSLDLKNGGGINATDPKTIQIDPYYDVTVTAPASPAAMLPTNGGSLTASFTLQNIGAVNDSYDLLTTKKPGTALSVVSITGTTITQGANPDSARRGTLASNGTVTVVVTYRVGNIATATLKDTLFLMGRSLGNPVKTSTGYIVVTVIRPVLTIGKAVAPGGTPAPGTDLTFTSTLTNAGAASASSLAVVDSIPSFVQFKLASASTTLPAGVTATIKYSNDGGVTWTYVPASGGCSAPAGFDRCVNRIQWTLQQPLSSVAPNNSGTLQFVSRIR